MTPVQWLQNSLDIHFSFEQKMQFEGLFQQALEMEKEQIIDAYDLGMGHYGDANRRSDAEQYYNETFNKK